jgi:hypothetical protein
LLESGVGEGLFFAGLKHVAIKVVASYTEDQIITSDPSQLLAIKPVLGESVPAITLILIKMYRTQINAEAAERKAFEEEQAALARREEERQRAQLMIEEQTAAEQAAETVQYEEAANDENYDAIPETKKKAA